MSSNTTPTPPAFFSPSGQEFHLRDPSLVSALEADLWNDRMRLFIDHRGRCRCGILQPDLIPYAEPQRSFFVRDGGRLWGGPVQPGLLAPESWLFTVSPHKASWRLCREKLQLSASVFLPVDECCESWQFTLQNLSTELKKVSLFPVFPVGLLGLLDQQGYFDPQLPGLLFRYFPYYVKIEDYEKLAKRRNLTYALSNDLPTAWQTSAPRFTGAGSQELPEEILQGSLRQDTSHYEAGVAALQFDMVLTAGQEATLRLLFGASHHAEELPQIRDRYLSEEGWVQAEAESARFHHSGNSYHLTGGPPAWTHYVNHWLPDRIRQLGRTLRHNLSPQGRNAIQDATAIIPLEPQTARRWWLRIWAHQQDDGFLPHGMPMHPDATLMPITTIPHRDTNVWTAPAMAYYLAETGDWNLLEEKVPFAGCREPASILHHIHLALDWLLQDRTERCLSRIGQGDWNDPLNMAGPKGRGESFWLSMALVYALRQWAPVLKKLGWDREARHYESAAAELAETVDRLCWDGAWYARGTTDAGRVFGTSKDPEGTIFLNTQSWAMISGIIPADKIDQVIAAVDERLMTPWGPMLLAPAFEGMRKDIGKLTLKCPGTGENGSVYCHAAVFYAYGLYTVHRPEKAWSILQSIFPGETVEQWRVRDQAPLYLPNFYRGNQFSRLAGRSSHSPTTGTAPWYFRTVLEKLYGLEATLDGLRIHPQFPADWPRECSISREFRGKKLTVRYRRCSGFQESGAIGSPLMLPWSDLDKTTQIVCFYK